MKRAVCTVCAEDRVTTKKLRSERQDMSWKPSLSQRKESGYGDQSESEFQKESQITPREVK